MAKPKSTDITIIVDRSGSMSSIAADMRGGFDSFIKKQREVAGECRVSLVRFDTEYESVYTAVPVADVAPLVLEPRGSTALLDAIGLTINATGKRLASMREEDRPSQVLFVIITDGHENASREFRRETVLQMVEHQRSNYQWEFIYLGANQDAIQVASGIGMAHNAVTYDANQVGAHAMFSSASAGIAHYRGMEVKTMGGIVTQDKYAQAKKEEENKAP